MTPGKSLSLSGSPIIFINHMLLGLGEGAGEGVGSLLSLTGIRAGCGRAEEGVTCVRGGWSGEDKDSTLLVQ